VDEELEEAMRHVRTLAEGLRALRAKAGVKNRVPLAEATIVRRDEVPAAFESLVPILQAEANVKKVGFATSSASFEASEAKINQRSVGRAMKSQAKPVLAAVRTMDPRDMARRLEADGKLMVETDDGPVDVAAEHFTLLTVEAEGTVKAESGPYACFLDTKLTPELEAEGWAREIVRRIQEMRKDADCALEETISTRVEVTKTVAAQLGAWTDFIKDETRSRELAFTPVDNGAHARDWDIEGEVVRIGITRASE
jgi:isoleucyl-tRNA synthetase